jgi:hypothetical protein
MSLLINHSIIKPNFPLFNQSFHYSVNHSIISSTNNFMNSHESIHPSIKQSINSMNQSYRCKWRVALSFQTCLLARAVCRVQTRSFREWKCGVLFPLPAAHACLGRTEREAASCPAPSACERASVSDAQSAWAKWKERETLQRH